MLIRFVLGAPGGAQESLGQGPPRRHFSFLQTMVSTSQEDMIWK